MELPSPEFNVELIPGSMRALVEAGDLTKKTLWSVAPETILVIDGFNVRVSSGPVYEARVAALANSIAENGWYEDKPLTCYVGKDEAGVSVFYLIDGHCRLAAIDLLRKNDRPAPEKVTGLVKPSDRNNMADLLVAMAHTGEPLTPYELAVDAKRLAGLGLEDKKIADRLSLTPGYLKDLWLLVAAVPAVQTAMAHGQLAPTLVIQETKDKGPKAATKALVAAVKAAEKVGKTRATRKDVTAATAADPTITREPRPLREGVTKYLFEAKVDDTAELDMIRPFQHLDGGSWWELTSTNGHVRITRPVKVRMTAYLGPAPVDPPAEAPAEEPVLEGAEGL